MDLKRNVIQKKDYERYSVRLPFRVFLSRKRNRNRFLFGELEKLHPCFSDECSFDSRLRLEKKGLVSDVVVMNSLKLSEYKARYLGKRLFLEENPEKVVFKGNGEKRFLTGGVFVLLLAAAGIRLFLSGVNKKAADQKQTYTDMEVSGEEKKSSLTQIGRPPGEITDLFLSAVEGDSAFLSELEWKCDGMNESFFASVGYIVPDRLMKIDDLEFSSVTYRENVPFFTAKGKCRLRKNSMSKTEIVWANGKSGIFNVDENVFSELRNIIGRAGAELVEESFNPWKIRFILKNASLDRTENLVSEMAGFILETGIAIRRLVIRKGGFDDFELEIETAPDLEPFMGVNLSILEKRFRLFGLKNEKEKVQSYQIAVGKKSSDKNSDVSRQENLRKIGEIRHKDGSFVVYFKNKQGKILSEVVN